MSVAFPPAPADPVHRGSHGSRMRRPLLLAAFAGILAIVLVGAFLAIKGAAPAARKAQCPGGPCSPPITPLPPETGPALVSGTQFTSSALGFQLEFNQDPRAAHWSVGNKSKTSLQLDLDGANAVMVIDGFPASTTPQDALASELSKVSGVARNVVQDNSKADQILEPSVGYRRGVGGVFVGTLDTPQGPGT